MKSLKFRKEIMKEIKELTDKWFEYVDDFGNECAYTDDLISKIKTKSSELLDEISE